MDEQALQQRILRFQQDLRVLDLRQVIRKHITTGDSAVLSNDEYYELRSEVANHFNLHPSEVVVVGSARTGFSVKPSKRYAAYNQQSDIDIAIISRDKFEDYWNLVFDHWRVNRFCWVDANSYKAFLRDLFQGWLWPRKLPNNPQFKEAISWSEFEDKLGREKYKGLRSVGARLYLSWDRLEAYQSIHVLKCKTGLR